MQGCKPVIQKKKKAGDWKCSAEFPPVSYTTAFLDCHQIMIVVIRNGVIDQEWLLIRNACREQVVWWCDWKHIPMSVINKHASTLHWCSASNRAWLCVVVVGGSCLDKLVKALAGNRWMWACFFQACRLRTEWQVTKGQSANVTNTHTHTSAFTHTLANRLTWLSATLTQFCDQQHGHYKCPACH